MHRFKAGGEDFGLVLVERTGLERIRAMPSCGSWTGGTPAPMARLGERGDGGDGHPTDPTERESRRAVRYGRMDGGDGGAVGFGCEPSSHRPPTETSGNVECPRSFVPEQVRDHPVRTTVPHHCSRLPWVVDPFDSVIGPNPPVDREPNDR